jgi:hypothetical protein
VKSDTFSVCIELAIDIYRAKNMPSFCYSNKYLFLSRTAVLIQELARPPGKVLEQGFKPITGARDKDLANQSDDHGGGGDDQSLVDQSRGDPDDHVKYETYLELKLWVSTENLFFIILNFRESLEIFLLIFSERIFWAHFSLAKLHMKIF